MSKRYIQKQLYTFDFQIKTGNQLLNDKIKIVLGYLIYKTHFFFKKLEETNHLSNDPYTPLSSNKLIKLCGKRDNYIAVLKYLEENEIISWYKSGHGDAKNGSYYSGNANSAHKGTLSKDPYCRKCRLTNVFWNAVKNNNVKLINVKVPNNDLTEDSMFDLNQYDLKRVNNEFNWEEYYQSKKTREEFDKNLQKLQQDMENNTKNNEKVENDDLDIESLLGDLVVSSEQIAEKLSSDSEIDDLFSELEDMKVEASKQGFGDFIVIG